MRSLSGFLLHASLTASLLVALPSCRGDGDDADPTADEAAASARGGIAGSRDGADDSDAAGDKAARCTGTFGRALTNAFGRLDGTVLAVVRPSDRRCPWSDDDHVMVEVVADGDAYRMIVNVQSKYDDPDVLYLATPTSLPGPAWSEGWHPRLDLDYASDFGARSSEFRPHALHEMSNILADAISIGQKVSVYASSSGGSWAHKVHRNNGWSDGAIVLDADGPSAQALLFRFASQSF